MNDPSLSSRPRERRRVLLVLVAIGASALVLTLILLATVPAVWAERTKSVPFAATLDPNGTAAYAIIVHAPTFCPPSNAIWNGTVAASFSWRVESGHPLLVFNLEQFTPPNSPIIYWSNGTAGGSFHFLAYCAQYAFAAESSQAEIVQVDGTWNYTYRILAPIL